MKKFDIYEMVTNLIVERLEADVILWQMPWKSGGSLPKINHNAFKITHNSIETRFNIATHNKNKPATYYFNIS